MQSKHMLLIAVALIVAGIFAYKQGWISKVMGAI